jgi:adenylate cyclase
LTIVSRGQLRALRLYAGIVLFAFVTCHFLNHAMGFRSMAAMDAAAPVLLGPWQTLPGMVLLLGAFVIHAVLGLRALYRRRTLRMPAIDMTQLVLGLLTPLLVIHHIAGAALSEAIYGMQVDYERVVYQLWIGSPFYGLPRQFLLLIVVWIHGCIGIRGWLRTKSWYAAWAPTLFAGATMVPVLAILGFVNAGLDMRDLVASGGAATLAPHVRDMPGSAQAAAAAHISAVADRLAVAWIVLVAGVLALRSVRDWASARFRSVRVTYPGGRTVTVPAGFSVLEASRWADIPHASACGGRGRCSTCRVEIVAGGEGLAGPSPEEQRLLERIGAPPSVRLACQIRPTTDIAILPLVNPTTLNQQIRPGRGALDARRRETEVAALFVDLRQSTQLADERLPYDALFIVERYVNAVTAGVRRSGGHVINVAGDGVMSVFGVNGTPEEAARAAFAAALAAWREIDALSAEIADELPAPLRFGMGLHVGLAVVGVGWDGGMESAPFLGDTGNVAARLETASKKLARTLVASRDAVELITTPGHRPDFIDVTLAGKQEQATVATFADPAELEAMLAEHAAA